MSRSMCCAAGLSRAALQSALRELGREDVTYFSPDEDPVSVAALIARYFQNSHTARLAIRARASFRWEVIYRQHIVPLL